MQVHLLTSFVDKSFALQAKMFSVIGYAFSKVSLEGEVESEEFEQKEDLAPVKIPRPIPKNAKNKNHCPKIQPQLIVFKNVNSSHANEDSWKGRLYRNLKLKYQATTPKASRLEVSVRTALKTHSVCSMLNQVRTLVAAAPPCLRPMVKPKPTRRRSERGFIWKRFEKQAKASSERGVSNSCNRDVLGGGVTRSSLELAIVPSTSGSTNHALLNTKCTDGSQRNVFEFLLSCLTPSASSSTEQRAKYRTLQDRYDHIS